VPLSELGYRHVGCALQCESGRKFDPAAMSPLGSDVPEFSLGLAHTLVSSIESLLSGHSLSVPGPGTFGPLFKYLPPPIKDHLQDRYYNALTQERAENHNRQIPTTGLPPQGTQSQFPGSPLPPSSTPTSPAPPTSQLQAEEIQKILNSALGALLRIGGSAREQEPIAKQPQTVDLLYATNRQPSFDDLYYSGERSDTISHGTVSVRVPESHRIGKVELPLKLHLFSLTLYEQPLDPEKHFVINSIDVRTLDDWKNLVSASEQKSALVFVHGFNNTFRNAVYRTAQIMWDLQYSGLPVLFSWPSRGAILDYIYDRDSALGARDAFIETLRNLRSAGISRVDILAHSMGNLVVLDSLAGHSHTSDPLGIAEILMAAPDLDKDHYKSIVAKVRAAASGVTLYASSADRALTASKRIAGKIARAGDVPASGPILVDGVDTIDVTAIGAEMFGLGHDPFASTRSVLNDIAIILSTGTRPPNKRLVEIRGMPVGAVPKWWRYSS
jgi:esterase/lipase superfamily enzyme